MTVAVCLKCGAMKWGAWVPCPSCQYEPASNEDRARHVMVSDHFLSKEQLEAAASRIKAGETLTFDESQVRMIAEEYARMPVAGRACLVAVIGVVVVAGTLTCLIVWLVSR